MRIDDFTIFEYCTHFKKCVPLQPQIQDNIKFYL